MPWNRLYLKHWIKDKYKLPRDKEDGLLTDTHINEAINDAIEDLADDAGLLPSSHKLPLRIGQWEYPIPDHVNDIVKVWYVDSDGTRSLLRYVGGSEFLRNRDPEDDTATDPYYFSYPKFQNRVLAFYTGAAPVYDYVTGSWVTTKAVRTVIDAGINFGKTLDGTPVEPNCVVHNLTDDSYGYVDVMDITTTKESGTATSETSTTILEDTTADFVTANVAVGDIICTPGTGVVNSYGFVTAVDTTKLTYANFQSSEGTTRFALNDTYKVGVANRIRLSDASPHPGLRSGAANEFSVGTTKATITGTTFTATTVTGSSTSGAEEDDIAIASGGSHGKVTEVDDNELTVDMWIGGTPAPAETVTVNECDAYQIETEFRIERVLQIGPTPASSDTIGSESILIECNSIQLPSEDDDPIEIPRNYRRALQACLMWKAAERTGADDNIVHILEANYQNSVRSKRGDIYRPPTDQIMSVVQNRRGRVRRYGVKDQDRRGIKWTI